jgi:hypothetical protein
MDETRSSDDVVDRLAQGVDTLGMIHPLETSPSRPDFSCPIDEAHATRE